MKITLMNRRDAIAHQPKGSAVALRLDSQYPLSNLKGNYQEILVQVFEDIPYECSYSIKDEDAKDIVNFVKENEDKEEILVHCHHKQGRSPAAAIAIQEYLGLNQFDINDFPDINMLVLEKLRKEFNK